jgi:hypothetical protein
MTTMAGCDDEAFESAWMPPLSTGMERTMVASDLKAAYPR